MISIPFVIYDDGGTQQSPQAVAIIVNGKIERFKCLLQCPSHYKLMVYQDMIKAFRERYPQFNESSTQF